MKNKLIIFIVLVGVAASLLTGCSSATAVTATSGLTEVSKLAVGTLKLEGTDQAVTKSQAAELLTLWQGYESLSSSDTTSTVELNALVSQIESTMTSEQIKAIEAMDLNEQSVSEALSTLGGNVSASTSSGTPSASMGSQSGSSSTSGGIPSASSGGMPPSSSGSMPSGGPSGMPSGGMPTGGDSSGVSDVLNGTSAQSTPSASQSTTGSGSEQINPMLLQAVIQLLETRSQSAG